MNSEHLEPKRERLEEDVLGFGCYAEEECTCFFITHALVTVNSVKAGAVPLESCQGPCT